MPKSAARLKAIAFNLREMTKLTVPVIVTVIGEGGSGGALAIGVGDQILMLENAIYSGHLTRGLRRDSLEGFKSGSSRRRGVAIDRSGS
jgi:hypothetical protein